MNTTLDSTDGSNPNLGGEPLSGIGFSIGLSLGVLIIFVIITYISYMCQWEQDDTTTLNHRSFASGHSIGAASMDHNFSIVTIQLHNGLDETTLSSYPQFTYSQLKPQKSDSTTSACSICLADYNDDDLLRLLPDCDHFFHLKCIDPWLILHPTCPICRYSPLPTPHAPATLVPT